MDIDSVSYPPGLCPRISFIIDLVSRSLHHCDYCDEEMRPGDLRVQQRSKSYHLACYRPDIHMRIERQNVRNQVESGSKGTFEAWLKRYNEEFRTVGKAEVEGWKVKSYGQFGRRRELVEAFKGLSVKDLACSVSRVCKAWRAQSLDSEIWTSLIQCSFPSAPALPYSPRLCYQYLYLSCCYGCSLLFPPASEVLTKHPVTAQPLCQDCFPRQFFNPVLVVSYCEYLGVSGDYLRSAQVRTFRLGSKLCLMPYEAKGRIVALRKDRMVKLVNRMKETPAEKYLLDIDLETYYKRKDVQQVLDCAPNLSISTSLYHLFYAADSTALTLKRPSIGQIKAAKRAKLV